jgi:hypothetical protein
MVYSRVSENLRLGMADPNPFSLPTIAAAIILFYTDSELAANELQQTYSSNLGPNIVV